VCGCVGVCAGVRSKVGVKQSKVGVWGVLTREVQPRNAKGSAASSGSWVVWAMCVGVCGGGCLLGREAY
jgi:hypothetical protein